MNTSKTQKYIVVSLSMFVLFIFSPSLFRRSSKIIEHLKLSWSSGKESVLADRYQKRGNQATSLDQASEAISYFLESSDNAPNLRARKEFAGRVIGSVNRGYQLALNMQAIDRANSEQMMKFSLNISAALREIGKDSEAIGWERLSRLILWRIGSLNRRLENWETKYPQAEQDTGIHDLAGKIESDFCLPRNPAPFFRLPQQDEG